MYCWACNSSDHDAEGCHWICRQCGHRLPSALGHGPACECPDAREQQEAALTEDYGPDVAGLFMMSVDPAVDPEEGQQALDLLLGLVDSSE